MMCGRIRYKSIKLYSYIYMIYILYIYIYKKLFRGKAEAPSGPDLDMMSLMRSS